MLEPAAAEMAQAHRARLDHEILGQVVRYKIGETRVPVKYGEQVMEHHHGPEQIRKVGVALGPVEEAPEPVDFDEAEAAQYRVVADAQIQNVERHQTQTVDVEPGRVHVVVSESDRVGLEHALLEEARPKVEHYVAYVQKVGQVVEGEPVELVLGVDLVERVAVDHHPEVVQERERHDEAHPVAESPVRVEYERHVALGHFVVAVQIVRPVVALPALSRFIRLSLSR